MFRIGEGYDIHELREGHALVLGCTEIPSPIGAFGHSDGDVLAHAVCDAIFGALAEPDIGHHFPPTDPRWEGVASRIFLEHAARLLRQRGGSLVNLDTTVVLEAPKLAPYIAEMRAALADALGCEQGRISIKAKTAEKLGPVGEGRALEARAIVLVELERP